ncbi:peroxiredoxin family protein [Tenacibaculum caenipelagi]|uniref:AhpC/TSA family protein n=1 Tax=Tenacibaculum caenipelagi TaxID=1325435 RepID=A0A4R6TCI1_9FLAO|nr:redoxin domain-containing protein [Tenacibaculum caenipelagi]TDQ27505.1 AhpC/TSA family protein [Tenacibaculum caenipelagi]
MDKKKVLFIVIFGIVSILFYFSYSVITKSKEKDEIAKQIQTIPKFKLQTLDNNSFTNSKIKPSLPTIFIYFNSDCDFCHHEAKNISQNLNKFKDVQFIFVSSERIKVIKQFSEKYNLNNKSNITFLYDSDYLFSRQFNANSIPYILIYNKNKELIKKQNGQLNAKGILKVLNQND